MAKIEVSDATAKLWEQAGALDEEIRKQGVTVPVGFREVTPDTRESFAAHALQQHVDVTSRAIQRYRDQRQSREAYRKATEAAEKERLAHAGESHDAVGYFKPIPDTLRMVLAVPEKPADQYREILRRLAALRNYGGIRRVVRVDEGPSGQVRVQYAPKEKDQSADLDLIGVVFAVRNGMAANEQARFEDTRRMAPSEAQAREAEEEARWAAYS